MASRVARNTPHRRYSTQHCLVGYWHLSASETSLHTHKKSTPQTASPKPQTDCRQKTTPAPLPSLGRSRVESLAIENGWRSRKERKDTDDNFPQEQSLLRALPALPALEHLHLQSQAPPQLLLALGPDTTPALRTLELGVYAMGFDVQHHCLHSWLHDNIIADDLLKVHPSIKLIPPPFEYYCSVPKDCTWCKSGCHQELSGNDRPLFRDALLKVCS
ncbi:hypothetical protein FOCC_FOCC000209 [Frankliniella occidentalis]|nr:hypothetical protein FOCC_FOCC000209 [Frankliniella occidentalis]